jgi:hypothetical protein
VRQDRISYDLQIDNAAEPFWLAVDQSWNGGWRATVDGVRLPLPTLIDTYGNGWFIAPEAFSNSPLNVHVEWAPQRMVWVAIVVSSGAVVTCLILVWVGRGRRRDIVQDDPAAPMDPILIPPFRDRGPTMNARGATVGAAVITAVVMLLTPWHGWGVPLLLPLVVGLSLTAFRLREGHGLLALVGAACLGAVAAYIAAAQVFYLYRADFNWPAQFEGSHLLGLVAIFLLLVEAVRDLIVSQAGRADPLAPADDPNPPATGLTGG